MRKNLINPIDINREIYRKYETLIKIHNQLEKNINKYPEGDLHIVSCKGRVQYRIRYDRKEKSGVYISKKNTEKLQVYNQKKYDKTVIRMIALEISRLETFLQSDNNFYEKVRNIYSNNPEEVKRYIRPIDMSDKDYIEMWEANKYAGKTIGGQNTEYETEKGEIVRSKSELNIANMLCKKGIPYKYEAPLTFSSGRTVYPDFTILDVKRRCLVYWEHRGMMDDEEYASNAILKMKAYENDNLFLGDRLIITEETKAVMLGTRDIERIISHYFM